MALRWNDGENASDTIHVAVTTRPMRFNFQLQETQDGSTAARD